MPSYNKVILMGNLTRDPELKYLPSGAAVANFGLAINRQYTDRESGEKREEVCFVEIETWERQAENCNQYLSKGSLVLVDGRLKYDTWETDEGQKRSKLRVRAYRVQFMPKSTQTQQGGQSQEPSKTPQQQPSAQKPEPEVGTEDDIPF